jgi:hypothetical protein
VALDARARRNEVQVATVELYDADWHRVGNLIGPRNAHEAAFVAFCLDEDSAELRLELPGIINRAKGV